MITGAHAIIYTRNADADREFLSSIFGLPAADAGGGWLIFGLPPSELAFHPSRKNNKHELYLLCDNVKKFVAEMEKRAVKCSPVQRQPWGLLTGVTLPGGGALGVYEPLHPRPRSPVGRRKAQPPGRAAGR
jgi:hypothetical protein